MAKEKLVTEIEVQVEFTKDRHLSDGLHMCSELVDDVSSKRLGPSKFTLGMSDEAMNFSITLGPSFKHDSDEHTDIISDLSGSLNDKFGRNVGLSYSMETKEVEEEEDDEE